MSGMVTPSRGRWMIAGIVVVLALVVSGVASATTAYAGIKNTTGPRAHSTAGNQLLTSAVMSAEVPNSPEFYDPSFDVLRGSHVSLHWTIGSGAPPNRYFLITSDLPGFSSSSVVTWPAGTSPSPTWTTNGWRTTANALTVSIPANATPGTQYTVTGTTCDSTGCSPSKNAVLTVPSSPTSWVTRSYASDYSGVTSFAAPGQPFATTFLASDNSIWTASEFSHNLTEIKNNATSDIVRKVVVPKGSSAVFLKPFAFCGVSPCVSSLVSAQSEQVITTGGMIWLTFGGQRWYRATTPANHSEVVAFDPTTKKFCTYLVPGDNNEVAGVASTGTGSNTRVWFVESRGAGQDPSLDAFDPATVGGGCDGRADEAYVLPESVRLLKWPTTGGQWPAQIAVDPSSRTLWITNFDGYGVGGKMYSDIEQVNISDQTKPSVMTRYVIPSANSSSLLGPKPWNIVAPAHSDYVYAIDNGDAEIVRIDKVTRQIDELAIPLTVDYENGFGLAISSGRLYFTLADDVVDNYGAASTFGYVDLSSWSADSSHADGVIYTGLSAVTNPTTKANYRSIAVGSTGQVSITNQFGVIRLTSAG